MKTDAPTVYIRREGGYFWVKQRLPNGLEKVLARLTCIYEARELVQSLQGAGNGG